MPDHPQMYVDADQWLVMFKAISFFTDLDESLLGDESDFRKASAITADSVSGS
jgi:hypothetical protein